MEATTTVIFVGLSSENAPTPNLLSLPRIYEAEA
jgi:hypothetical protein